MNARLKELQRQANQVFGPDEMMAKFAELVEQDCIDKFIKVWYKQGLDVRGAELHEFMLCYEELDNDSVPS